jgi:hypothetical protein
MEENKTELYLIYVNEIGENTKGEYEYEFVFSETPETAWGADWEISPASICTELTPDSESISFTKRLISDIKLNVGQKNNCFSMQDIIDGIFPLCYVELNEEVFIFMFGEEYNDVENKIKKIDELC